MGKKIKTESDLKLALNHKAGAPVQLVQPSLHSSMGLIYIPQPRYWLLHQKFTRRAYLRLKTYEGMILGVSIGQDNSRTLQNPALVDKLYKATVDYIINTYLVFDYLSLDILINIYGAGSKELDKNENLELKEKMKVIFTQLNCKELLKSPGYGILFSDIENLRHSLNHPKRNNIYNSLQNQWDCVPLSWVVSGKYIEADRFLSKFLNDFFKVWETNKAKYEKPGTLTVIRGIKSLHQVKKNKEERGLK